MNTSASTRSGRISEILRTAASPLPTATTSMPWSFSARPTIFWILLLSAATRILATERPPGRNTRMLCDTVVRPHFVRPAGRLPQPRHPASHLEVTPRLLEHPAFGASTPTGGRSVGSEHGTVEQDPRTP